MGIRTVIIADPYHKTVMVEVPDTGVLQIDFDALYSQLG